MRGMRDVRQNWTRRKQRERRMKRKRIRKLEMIKNNNVWGWHRAGTPATGDVRSKVHKLKDSLC